MVLIKWTLIFLSIWCISTRAVLIDIVYLWVDGSDQVWQAIKNHYLALEKTRAPIIADAATNNRFEDHEELKYSLRSLVKYAPFFNHIYIVTMNQRPAWLLSHPKITIVDHHEIFQNQENLPVFNSHAIESNIHRIPGLQEYFIYFNDDVFLGASVSVDDFFTPDGLIKVLFECTRAPETAYRQAWRNTNAFLDAHYTIEPRNRLCHAPFALRKSFIEAFDQEFPEIFAGNSMHRFRSGKDFNVTNGLLQYYWLYHGKIETGTLSNVMISLRGDHGVQDAEKKFQSVLATSPHTFCIQDVMTGNTVLTNKLLHDFLEACYPQPAPWEKL